MNGRPLILVTRPAPESGIDQLVTALVTTGLRVACVPTISLQSVAPGGPLDDAVSATAGWDWIVVTSATGARAVASAIARAGGPRSSPDGGSDGPRWAAVGPSTAAALADSGIRADLVPRRSSGAATAAAIIGLSPTGRLDGRRILLARADAAAPDLPTRLRAAGADVHDVIAYRTFEGPADARCALVATMADPDLAAIVFASGSAARGLVALLDADPAALRCAGTTPAVAIGPATSAVLRDLGFANVTEAVSPSVPALAAAVLAVVGRAPRAPGPASVIPNSEPTLARRPR